MIQAGYRARGPPFKSFVRIHPRNDLEVNMKTIKIKDYYGIYQEIPVSDEM